MTAALITLSVCLASTVALLGVTMLLWRLDLRDLSRERDKRANAERLAAEQTARAIDAEAKYASAVRVAERLREERRTRDKQIASTGSLSDVVGAAVVQFSDPWADEKPAADNVPSADAAATVPAASDGAR